MGDKEGGAEPSLAFPCQPVSVTQRATGKKSEALLPTPPQPLACVSQLYNHLFLGVCLMKSFFWANIYLPTNTINLLLGSG